MFGASLSCLELADAVVKSPVRLALCTTEVCFSIAYNRTVTSIPFLKNSLRTLVLFCAAMYLFVVAVLVVGIRRSTGGHFVYALDDPYIHLALAQQIAHGHYGINPGEASSPSSSLLWPFLLVPFAGTRFQVWLPLLWNVVFGTTAACLIGAAVARWPPQRDESGRMPLWQQMATGGLLILAANLGSQTIVGMEHVLQVLLSICCAFGMMEALSDRPIPGWCLAAAVVAPSVRYEDLTLAVALCMALAGRRQWKTAACVLCLGVAPLLTFAVFLKSQGLPGLPLSVLVKGSAYAAHISTLHKMVRQLRNGLQQSFTFPERYSIVLLTLIFAALAWQTRERTRRYVYLGAAALGGLQLAVGAFGWFYRYQVYALIFLLMVCMKVLSERPRFLFGYFVMGLVFCASPFVVATETTIPAADEIYRQQYQERRFVTEFYRGNYAVNDLGLVSFERRPGAYVLDVYGLGSVEAAERSEKTAAWLEDVVKRHDADLAMLYPMWFDIPLSWTPVAKLCVTQPPVNLPEPCMVFYSTSPAAEPGIREDLKRFAPTLPPLVKFYFDPSRKEGGVYMPG